MNYIASTLSVFIGALLVYLFRPKDQKKLKLILAFSGAFLLAITVFDLLPEVFEGHEHNKHIGIWIMFGILLQKILEYFSKGAEHGHFHLSQESRFIPNLIFISLSIHAFLEGFPIHNHQDVLIGIIVHKIPVAMILTMFLLKARVSKMNIFIYLTLFAVMTPLGTFVAEKSHFISSFYKEISAIVIGIFLHVSTTILFESNEGHKFNITKLAVILLATLTAYAL